MKIEKQNLTVGELRAILSDVSDHYPVHLCVKSTSDGDRCGVVYTNYARAKANTITFGQTEITLEGGK